MKSSTLIKLLIRNEASLTSLSFGYCSWWILAYLWDVSYFSTI